jgi:hypothetical protein
MNLRVPTRRAQGKRARTVKESVIWGAIVGIALGVMVTFALARGLLALPWQAEVPADAPTRPLVHEWQDLDGQTRTSLSPVRTDEVEPRRPARPGSAGSVASVASSQRGLSRS